MNLNELIKTATAEPLSSSLFVQFSSIKASQTKQNKPYFDVEIADESQKSSIKVWSDSSAFEICENAKEGQCFEISGLFSVNQYGLNVAELELRPLNNEECESFFSGSPERQELIEELWSFINSFFENVSDDRLRLVCQKALSSYEVKWKRAAAATTNHHARRGGLLEHTVQMLKNAQALAPEYSDIIWEDLLYAGVLFHDIGKLWEKDYSEKGFDFQPTGMGELLGHIPIGIEVANKLWVQVSDENKELFQQSTPPSQQVREHLLHLIASHHGELQFGAVVTPKTPEAFLLHFIDNIDAKMEMLRLTYREKEETRPGFFEARRPLFGLIAKPLITAFSNAEQIDQ